MDDVDGYLEKPIKALQLRFQDGGTDIEQMMKEKGEEVVPWLKGSTFAQHFYMHL